MDQVTFQHISGANGDSILLNVDVPHDRATQLNFRWARSTPPKAILQTENRVSSNRAWLVNHIGEYKGKWVALRDGVLLGSADSLAALGYELRSQGFQLPSSEIMLTTGF